MITTNWMHEINKNDHKLENNKEVPISDEKNIQLSDKLHTDVEHAESVFLHFDHIQGESEIDRYQIFSNLFKAAAFLGLNVEKIDFHRRDA